MIKNIQYFIILLFFSYSNSLAQGNDSVTYNTSTERIGYYQTINLDNDTPCQCDQKTERTLELNRGLRDNDVVNYDLHAYSFSFGNSTAAASKLFKSFESDLTVYKISMKEWTSFMLLTTDKFDVESFEKAAAKVFPTFTKMQPEDFLKNKNMKAYQEYVQKLDNDKNSPSGVTKSEKEQQ